MPRRVKQSRSLLAPLAENFIKRISGADARVRNRLVKYGFWAIGGFLLMSLMSGTYGVHRLAKLELTKSALIESNRSLEIMLLDCARIKNRLEVDADFIEKIARSRYRMVYPDETIFRFQGQK
jgi:cell division protein FtsB